MKRTTYILLIVYVMLFSVLGSSYADPDIAKKALAATVFLEVKTNKNVIYYGSGFFVSPTHIVTNYHVVAGGKEITVHPVDNSIGHSILNLGRHKIQYIDAVDEENDLAVLRAEIPNINPLPIGDSDKVEIGTQVYVMGNPQGLQGTFSNGLISRIEKEKNKRFQMTAPVSKGSSGGPVLNNEGKVIGVTSSGLEAGQNLNFAIPSEYVKPLLERANKRVPIDITPTSAETYYKTGNTMAMFELYEAAILEYDKAIRLDPNYADAYLNRGAAKANLGQHRDAIIDFNEAIRLDPNNFRSYHNRGATKADLGQHRDAITDYDRAIELKSDFANSYQGRGTEKLILGQYTQAILDLNDAIRLDPNNAVSYDTRGTAYLKLGQDAKAMSDYDEAIILDPYYVNAVINRGVLKVKLNQYRDAIDDYDKAILLEPDSPNIYLNRGNANSGLGQWAKAIDDYDKAIFFNLNEAKVYLYRGVAKYKLGQDADAQQDWQTALKLAEQAGDTELIKQIQELPLSK